MRNVDIIIPIYNAFEDLKTCLESLYKNTDLETNRLILINDNSSDKRVRPFLEKQTRKNVIVIHNEINKGFSNNINIGINQSDINDVILLNSDTILTSRWVEKMVKCAYSSKTIGTVTPLSNNATLCSVPKLFEENRLPDGMDLDQAAEIVEQCSLNRYPQITVAHGFCMLIKREVIKIIGGFDAETFGRGYGEENDFCNRAGQMGYIHVMCDDTYIYHSGTRSFVSKEKQKYIMEHQKILYDRYPKQMIENEKHVANNPNQLIGENIGRFWAINNGKKNILYVVQSDFREGAENSTGGTQMHVKHLMEGLRSSSNIFVAAIDGRYLQVTAYIGNEEYLYRFFVREKVDFFTFSDRNLARIFRSIFMAFQIDLVHIHHLLTMSLDVLYEAEQLNIPIIFTIHDFWSICPNISLRRTDGKICMKAEENHCAKCLAVNAKIYEKTSYIEYWRKQFQQAFSLCKMLIAPSESTKMILENYYPNLANKINVIYHGLDINKQMEIVGNFQKCKDISLGDYKTKISGEYISFQGRIYFQDISKQTDNAYIRVRSGKKKEFWIPIFLDYGGAFHTYIPARRLEKGKYILTVCIKGKEKDFYEVDKVEGELQSNTFGKDVFRVAFIGGISVLKGAEEIKKVVEESDDNICWFIMGDIGYSDLLFYENTHLIKLGRYRQENLRLLLEAYQIDAIGILSIWPETFSYTLSEALGMGIPFFTADIGALGERVRKLDVGKVVPIENMTKAVLECLKEWAIDEEAYQNEVIKIRQVTLKSQEKMCVEYCSLYEKYYQEATADKKILYDKKLIWEGMETAFLDRRLAEGGRDYISETEMHYVRAVQNSITWRIVNKLINIRFPFKDKLYRYLINRR